MINKLDFQNLFFYILVFLGSLPFAFYLKKGKENKNYIKFLLPFVVVIFVGGLYEVIGSEILRIDSKVWFRVYALLEFYSLLYFYYKLIKRKKIFTFFGILFILMFLHQLYEWFYYPAIGFNFIVLQIISTALVLTSSVIWFISAFNKLEEDDFHKNPVFYIIAAFLLYHCSTFIVFVVTDYLVQNKMKVMQFYMIVYYANLVLRGTLTIVFWKASTNNLKSN